MEQQMIKRGLVDAIPTDQFTQQLTGGESLRIKYGIDPTAPQVHIGRASVIHKLRHFQKLGHQIIIIIGDFTARIGDASDKESERQPMSEKDILSNVENYEQQLGQILDLEQTTIHYNSEWFNELNLNDFIRLAQEFSVAQMIERDNYNKRFQAGKHIGMHEFLYPILQGYDSVAIEADIEIGGTDQLFNMLAGRTLQRFAKQKEQTVLTYELLLAGDGRKMSSSWGNCIWVTDEPSEMFGKLMAIKDELLPDYFRLVSEISDEELSGVIKQLSAGGNPRALKADMAQKVVAIYHGEEAGAQAAADFDSTFRDKQIPQTVPEVEVEKRTWDVTELLIAVKLSDSRSAAKRLLEQGGVRRNGQPITEEQVSIESGDVIQVGKRHFVRIV